mmetsp:Transcript_21774/g.43833  ORF Transcript_21774/g.43833 Transcript_21774/m.43833 type:complete len:214 (-) Transcript_21774:668-1309(-)
MVLRRCCLRWCSLRAASASAWRCSSSSRRSAASRASSLLYASCMLAARRWTCGRSAAEMASAVFPVLACTCSRMSSGKLSPLCTPVRMSISLRRLSWSRSYPNSTHASCSDENTSSSPPPSSVFASASVEGSLVSITCSIFGLSLRPDVSSCPASPSAMCTPFPAMLDVGSTAAGRSLRNLSMAFTASCSTMRSRGEEGSSWSRHTIALPSRS